MTGATPLHCAIQSSKASSPDRQLQTVKALLDGGADPSIGDFFGSTAADYCQDGEDALKALLRIETPTVFGVIQRCNVQELESLLQQENVSSVVQSRHESLTPLLYLVNMLVEENDDDDDDESLSQKYLQMMELLLQHGADPDATPTAHRNGHLNVQEDPGEASLYRICAALKQNDASVDSNRFITLKNAALILKKYNATVSPTTQLLLHDAARRNQLEFSKFLVEDLGINVNTRGRQGMTPLQFAARSGKVEMVEFLLKQQEGIDITMQDDRGQTALDAARVNNKVDIVAILEEFLAKT